MDCHAPLVVIAAHMDEVGMIVARIEPDGCLRVAKSGGLLPWKIGERPVNVLGDVKTIKGVLSMGCAHGGQAAKPPEWEWSSDEICRYDQRLIVRLCELAQKAGTELQPVVYDGASSDASAVYSVGAAPRVAFVGHVRQNSHGFEVARLSCFDRVLDVLLAAVKEGLPH